VCPVHVRREGPDLRVPAVAPAPDVESFNEVSARYSVLPEEFYIPEVSQITTQSRVEQTDADRYRSTPEAEFECQVLMARKHVL
jgi:thymidylate synthase ThyX